MYILTQVFYSQKKKQTNKQKQKQIKKDKKQRLAYLVELSGANVVNQIWQG